MLEQSLSRARQLSDEVWEALDGIAVASDDRTRVAAALMNLSMSHYSAIVGLLECRRNASAFALVRPTIDGFLRSQWILFLASDLEIEGFAAGSDPPGTFTIVDRLIEKGIYQDDLKADLLKPIWGLISDFVHGGGALALRHISEGAIGPSFKDEELDAVLKLAKGWFVMCASAIASLAQLEQLQDTLKAIAHRLAS